MRKGALRVRQTRYLTPTSRCRASIPTLLSSECCFFFCRSPSSSIVRFRFCGDKSSIMSGPWELLLPLTLCAGVGRVVMEVATEWLPLYMDSEVLGESC